MADCQGRSRRTLVKVPSGVPGLVAPDRTQAPFLRAYVEGDGNRGARSGGAQTVGPQAQPPAAASGRGQRTRKDKRPRWRLVYVTEYNRIIQLCVHFRGHGCEKIQKIYVNLSHKCKKRQSLGTAERHHSISKCSLAIFQHTWCLTHFSWCDI